MYSEVLNGSVRLHSPAVIQTVSSSQSGSQEARLSHIQDGPVQVSRTLSNEVNCDPEDTCCSETLVQIVQDKQKTVCKRHVNLI